MRIHHLSYNHGGRYYSLCQPESLLPSDAAVHVDDHKTVSVPICAKCATLVAEYEAEQLLEEERLAQWEAERGNTLVLQSAANAALVALDNALDFLSHEDALARKTKSGSAPREKRRAAEQTLTELRRYHDVEPHWESYPRAAEWYWGAPIHG